MQRLEIFNQYRSLLFAIAYRMLGNNADAEDMVQEAWIRWQSTQTVVNSPKAFLSSIITRLCIDRLRLARVQREKYVGIWLPEPLMTAPMNQSEDHAELAESLSFAFLTLLECLSPTERAIFLLREVFDYDYSEIAKTVGKSIPNCRQIVRRARQHLVLRRPGISQSLQQKEKIVEEFLASWNQGDVHQLIALMAEDITFWSDGGGQVTAAHYPLQGCRKVARFLIAIRQSRLIPALYPQIVQINNQPGIVNVVEGITQSTFSFEFSDQIIKSIFAVVNPEKLKGVKL
ncbi:RNA polymerase sigma-70 factor [Vacuolonema iberomarrocanum]|uniref:RNA polymerase sigma-70 factor n=1 Tax=Vacuolonema iberomarrocanum TaxID=3454632 RepID=UPI0019FAF341|nr:RNA polymerase sigma-70 factor [filamentous cyanobacterium LEGE 07170]